MKTQTYTVYHIEDFCREFLGPEEAVRLGRVIDYRYFSHFECMPSNEMRVIAGKELRDALRWSFRPEYPPPATNPGIALVLAESPKIPHWLENHEEDLFEISFREPPNYQGSWSDNGTWVWLVKRVYPQFSHKFFRMWDYRIDPFKPEAYRPGGPLGVERDLNGNLLQLGQQW